MVKTELSYNPYLREMIVKFNGQAPRVNSLVEKYQTKKLQDWIELLPQIFHDEMNGYDFEFDFSGIRSDFEKIRETFFKAGVTEEQVSFFYKNELEAPVDKNKRVNELLEWLDKNRNRRFDYDEFKDKYKEFLDAPYSFVTVHGGSVSSITLSGKDISIENIDDVDEISSTDLTYTPVVMYVDSSDNTENRKNLQSIICRDDISNKQLFFCIGVYVNKAQTERIIYDLGIKEPIVVNDLSDERINEYFEDYPLTEYIKTFLDIFRKETTRISDILDAENRRSQELNYEIHQKIGRYDNDIKALKKADELFVQRDNFVVPEEYEKLITEFAQKVSDWRKKKTKTTSQEEALRMAEEFETELARFYDEYVSEIDNVSVKKSDEIDKMFSNWFGYTMVDTDYTPDVDCTYEAIDYNSLSLKERFMKIKTEQYIDPKNGLLNLFKGSNETKEKVLETTYTYENWRTFAMEEYDPLCKRVADEWTRFLSKYYSILAETYHKHISELITEITKQKNEISAQLSGDERLLQEDNDWLTALLDQIHTIERG